MVLGGVGAEFSAVKSNFCDHRADNSLDMAAHPTTHRTPGSSASRAAAATQGAPTEKPKAASSPKKEDLQPWVTNKDHPRFGDDWRYYVHLVRAHFHNQQTSKNALKLAKAWHHFMQAALGVGKLPALRLDVAPEPGDAPDVGEREAKSEAGRVEGRFFSYDNPFSNHYDMVAQQIAQSGVSTYAG